MRIALFNEVREPINHVIADAFWAEQGFPERWRVAPEPLFALEKPTGIEEVAHQEQ
ncbi:MAG: hypothetical protein LBI66_02145 [Burkholderiaceae bacterium]|jgi:hypothetical protein|nr:hypothetical protein [Burkholderiaceae bacterium]